MKTWFTSDLHFFHKNIVEYTNRGKETNKKDHDAWLLNLWNETISPDDTVFHLGDFAFHRSYEDLADILSKVNAKQIIMLKGNHDEKSVLNRLVADQWITEWHMYREIKIGDTKTVLHHFPISSWHQQGRGSYHLHGHCVDDATEILTIDGWKNRNELNINDKIYSYNINTNNIEKDIISEIIDINYSGNVYIGKGKSVDFRFTEEHTMIVKNDTIIEKIKVKEFKNNKHKIILSGNSNNELVVNLSDNMIKLYILIAADGNIKQETNLCRIRVKKQHKIIYIKDVLTKLNINYKIYESNDYFSFNFYIPSELLNFNIKGLDNCIIDFTNNQTDAVFDAYCNSDGYKNGNGVIIYSAKEKEIDLLQAMFCKNGYSTNKYSRYHGLGKNKQYQLSVYPKLETKITKPLIVEKVNNEHFWCVKTNNQTWIMRRNGVVQITGNCHGNLKEMFSQGLILDAGLDQYYNMYGKHGFFSEEQIVEIMKAKTKFISDHHADRE